MAEKSSWDQANRGQKHGLAWRNRKKISQIIKDYFYLPFFLLITLCRTVKSYDLDPAAAELYITIPESVLPYILVKQLVGTSHHLLGRTWILATQTNSPS
jgi:hypothetical protein